jgi:hypothetical protein
VDACALVHGHANPSHREMMDLEGPGWLPGRVSGYELTQAVDE